jgi:hypothetical protein
VAPTISAVTPGACKIHAARDLRRLNAAIGGYGSHGVCNGEALFGKVHLASEVVTPGSHSVAAVAVAGPRQKATGQGAPRQHRQTLIEAERDHFALSSR